MTHCRNALGLKNTSFSTYIVAKFNTLCVKNISSYRTENQIIRLNVFPEKSVRVSSASKAQKQMANTQNSDRFLVLSARRQEAYPKDPLKQLNTVDPPINWHQTAGNNSLGNIPKVLIAFVILLSVEIFTGIE